MEMLADMKARGTGPTRPPNEIEKMTTKAKKQWLSGVKKQRNTMSRLRRARRGTVYPHLVSIAGEHTWEGGEGDCFTGSDKEAQMVNAAGEAGGGAKSSQYEGGLLHSSGTENKWRCEQCGQFRVAPGSGVCGACTAETACVYAVVHHAELPGSGACLAHEPTPGLGLLDERNRSQDPRAFLPTPERTRGLPHCRLHCPTEDLVEDVGDCETLMPIQRHGSTPNEGHPAAHTGAEGVHISEAGDLSTGSGALWAAGTTTDIAGYHGDCVDLGRGSSRHVVAQIYT